MAAVDLICMTMTSVVLTSCGDDDDSTPAKKEYTLKITLDIINQGELTQAKLAYLKTNFDNKETKNLFTGFYDAKTATDEGVNVALGGIKDNQAYAAGCEYKVYFKLYDPDKSEVYKRTIYVIEDNYKVDN